MATTRKKRSTARRAVRKAKASPTAKRRGALKTRRRVKTKVKRAVKSSAKKRGPLARLAARTRKVLGIRKSSRKKAGRPDTAVDPLLDLPPAMPM